MRKRIWSVVLTLGILLAMKPDTVMAAKMERIPVAVQETDSREAQADQPKKETAETYGVSVSMEGRGTAEEPYRIQNAQQLRAFADMVNGVGGAPETGLCAVLTQNVDLSAACGAEIGSWTPIGTKADPYTGNFDGASFTVSGLYYHKSGSSYAGLFGYNSGVIKNLGVTGADIVAGSYAGGVCGFNNGTITGCYHAASVKGDKYTGGICGCNGDGGTVSVCYNTGAVSGSKYVGGVCGYNKNETFNCYNMGTVNGNGTSVGGVCGYNKKLLSNCYNTGEVSGGKDYVGSICGYNYSGGTLSNCYYLITGTEKGNYGAAKTQQQFASGEVCWFLNDGKSENVVWRQTCGMGFPAFGGKTVYQTETYRQNGNKKEVITAYTNDKNKRGISPQTASAADAESDMGSGESEGVSTGGHTYQEPEWKWKEYREARAVFTCLDCGEQLSLKAKISKEEKKATCAADGETVYTASVDRDGETYEDQKTVKADKTGHQTLEPITEKPVTCEESGIIRDCWMCPACKTYFTDEEGTEEIPRKEVVEKALGHDYKDDWVLLDDMFTVTFTCARSGCNKTDNETVKPKVETKVTCMEAGTVTYRATVKFKGKNYKHEETVTVEKLPHDYSKGPKWKWEKDYSAATATFTCAYRCGTKEPVIADIKKQTDSTEITYTAVVTFEGEEYTDVQRKPLDKTEHSYGEPELEVDYPTATFIFTCGICGTETPVKADNVTKSGPEGTVCGTPAKVIYTATVTFNGKFYEKTKEVMMPVEHKLIHYDEKPATCKAEGNKEYWKCSNCGKFFEDAEGKVEIPKIPVLPKTDHMLVPEGPEWKWEEKDDRWVCDAAVCTCDYCGISETVTAVVTGERTEPTCAAAGKIVYTAVVTFGGEEYSDEREKELEKTDHSYGEPVRWEWADDLSIATAIFSCSNCSASLSETASVDRKEIPGKDCGTPGRITAEAKVTYNGKAYTNQQEKKIPAEHKLEHVEEKKETCEAGGNKEYWKCEKCGKYFSDEEGTGEITDPSEIAIPAAGHKLTHVGGAIYECTECGGKFTVTVAPNGTTRIYSVEDDADIRQSEKENVEKQGDSLPLPTDVQDGQNEQAGKDGESESTGDDAQNKQDEGGAKEDGQNNQNESEVGDRSQTEQKESAGDDGQDEQDGGAGDGGQDKQDGEAGESGQTGQGGVVTDDSQTGRDEQAGEGISNGLEEQTEDDSQDGQNEDRDDMIDAQDNAARYGIIYPEGEETEGAWEANAVSFRAESNGNGEAQAAPERQGRSLWAPAALLVVLAGLVLFLALQKNRN